MAGTSGRSGSSTFARCGAPSPVTLRHQLLLLAAGLAAAAAVVAERAARAPDTCSRWPSDSAGEPPDWNECERCLVSRGFRVNSTDEVEIVWSSILDELPSIVCKLWAEFCSINSISPQIFAHSPCLRRIFLTNNYIEELPPDIFSNNSQLLHLELQRNKLVFPRDSVFLISSSLRILDLSYNNISAVYNKTFRASPNISILLLRGNKISDINYESLSSLNRLELLDVSENALSTIDFAPKLTMTCLYAGQNPLKNVFSLLMKFPMNSTLVFSQQICCCNVKYCIHSASQWISKCEQCYRKLTSSIPTTFKVPIESITSTIILYNDSTEASLYFDQVSTKQKSPENVMVPPLSSNVPENKKQTHTANITVILLSTVFSFLILVQSSIIVFLLIKSKRKLSPGNVYMEVKNTGVIIPSLIYGKNEQVTDLDEESYSQLSLNPVYETIPE